MLMLKSRKLETELKYAKGFLTSVDKKLSNERFVNNAPEDVVEKEKQKRADAEAKIRVIEEQINCFFKNNLTEYYREAPSSSLIPGTFQNFT